MIKLANAKNPSTVKKRTTPSLLLLAMAMNVEKDI